MGEKKKETTKCDKRIVICNVGVAQCENRTIKCEKKLKEPPNVTKIQSHVMFVLHNVRMKPSNVRKEKKEPPNMTIVLSNVMLELHNMRM